jgi:hypothetical protein
MNRIINCTCYLADLVAFAEFDTVYREVFANPTPLNKRPKPPSQRHWNRNRRHRR